MWPSVPGVGFSYKFNASRFYSLSNGHVVIIQPGSTVLLADKACVFS
jgi:hypothetical protein